MSSTTVPIDDVNSRFIECRKCAVQHIFRELIPAWEMDHVNRVAKSYDLMGFGLKPTRPDELLELIRCNVEMITKQDCADKDCPRTGALDAGLILIESFADNDIMRGYDEDAVDESVYDITTRLFRILGGIVPWSAYKTQYVTIHGDRHHAVTTYWLKRILPFLCDEFTFQVRRDEKSNAVEKSARTITDAIASWCERTNHRDNHEIEVPAANALVEAPTTNVLTEEPTVDETIEETATNAITEEPIYDEIVNIEKSATDRIVDSLEPERDPWVSRDKRATKGFTVDDATREYKKRENIYEEIPYTRETNDSRITAKTDQREDTNARSLSNGNDETARKKFFIEARGYYTRYNRMHSTKSQRKASYNDSASMQTENTRL